MFHPLQMGCKGYADRRVQSQASTALEGSVSPLCLLSLVEFLLYRGKADLTVLDENKNTALHLACSKVPPAVRVGLCKGQGLMKGLGLVIGERARWKSGLSRLSDWWDSFLSSCYPLSSYCHASTSQVFTLCPSPSGPREMCPHDPGRNPRPWPYQCYQQCAADVSALGRGLLAGGRGAGEGGEEVAAHVPGALWNSQCSLSSVATLAEGGRQLAIAPTSCSFFFLSSKAPTHCRPEWSSFCGAGPAESWGHSAGCG